MKHANRAGPYFLVPALLIIAFVLLFPIFQTIVLSFGRNSTSIFTGYEYAGLANYQRLLNTPRFITSLNNTIFFTAVTVPIELVIGIGLALVLDRNFRGKRAGAYGRALSLGIAHGAKRPDVALDV